MGNSRAHVRADVGDEGKVGAENWHDRKLQAKLNGCISKWLICLSVP